jgi:hypothetical protein
MRHVLNSIPYEGKDVVRPPDPKILGSAKSIYENAEIGSRPEEAT